MPEKAPNSQDEAGDHRKNDCYQQVDEEGEEAGEGEGGDHEDKNDHVRAEPGQEEVPPMPHSASEEEEGEGEVEKPGEEDGAKEGLMVPVQPGHRAPHHSRHLKRGKLVNIGAST